MKKLFLQLINNNKLKFYTLFIFPFLIIAPTFILHKMQLNWGYGDFYFHLNRSFEIYKDLQNGKIFPDVSYFSFNNNAYGVNFFYPYLINYLIGFLTFLTNKLVYSLFFAWFLVACFYNFCAFQLFYKITQNKELAINNALIFACITIYFQLGHIVNQPSLLVYSPFILAFISIIYYFQEPQKYYKFVCLFVALTIWTNVIGLLALFVLSCIIAIKEFIKNKTKFGQNFKIHLTTITIVFSLTALFIIPFLEQRLFGNDWLKNIAFFKLSDYTIQVFDSLKSILNTGSAPYNHIAMFSIPMLAIYIYIYIQNKILNGASI